MQVSKKVCMLGASAVRKTSLVRRFVHTIFDDKYHTTLGVKIDEKDIAVDDASVKLMLWDIEGQDDHQNVRTSFLRGTHGALFVVDRTRSETLNTALELRKLLTDSVGVVPYLLIVNKSDLVGESDIDADALTTLREDGWNLVEASAKTGVGVQDAFEWIVKQITAG